MMVDLIDWLDDFNTKTTTFREMCRPNWLVFMIKTGV